MLQVAADAVPAVGILHAEKRVVAHMCVETVRNFLMAFQALKRGRTGSELVAGVALGRAVEGFVRFRQRSWRDLGTGVRSHEQQSAEDQERAEKQADGRHHDADTAARCFCTEKRHSFLPRSGHGAPTVVGLTQS